MQLIIAEKPSVAANIAAALGANTRNDGYFEGNGYLVSFAFGHLFNLADTKDYNPDMEKWDLNDYPFIPDKFLYKVKDDPGTKKQVKILKELVKKADVVINACDGDREGEIIFAECKDYIGINKPIKRLWVTSHTPKAIEAGMNNLAGGLIKLERAGYCRQQIDWILGINLTVVYTLKSGGEITLKLGRVILPTLKLIFDREIEIANFKSKPFYMLKAHFKAGEDHYAGTYFDKNNNTRFDSIDHLKSIQNEIINQPGTLIKKDSKKSTEGPPKLFNLTDLQGHITSKFKGFTSDKVLDVMQSLYEGKYLTYPRTASRYLNESDTKDAEESLNAVLAIPGLNLTKTDVKFHTDKKVFDSSKVDSHPAIIPTYIVPELDKLSEDQRIVYTEVTKRFISQFMPLAEYENIEIITKVKDYDFVSKGKALIREGWKQLYRSNGEAHEADHEDNVESEDNSEEPMAAMNIKAGDPVLATDGDIKEGKTNPPAHYTEETLLKAMENCGKQVENEEEILKGYTIGTPATRAETIKKLFDCGYISKKGKSILITDLGAKIIYYFPVKRLLKTEFTGQIEKTLKDIENGTYDPEVFMARMIDYIKKNINEMKSSEMATIKKQVNAIGICPECGGNVIETDLAYSCVNTKNKSCMFTLWKDNKFFKKFGKKLTEKIAIDLVANKKVFVKGLKSPNKEGVKFDATIRIEKDAATGYWNYKMEFDNNKKKDVPKIKFKMKQ